jgi:hypothetical protein
MSRKPTMAIYQALQAAFDHFNQHLFDDELPDCVITIRSSNRVEEYFHHQRFTSPGGEFVDEIGLSHRHFSLKPVEEAMPTLVHATFHFRQHHLSVPVNPIAIIE